MFVHIEKIRYANDTDRIASIFLEPWAELFLISPGQKVDVVVTRSIAVDDPDYKKYLEHNFDPVVLSQLDEELVIWAPNNSVIEIYCNGQLVKPSQQTPRRPEKS